MDKAKVNVCLHSETNKSKLNPRRADRLPLFQFPFVHSHTYSNLHWLQSPISWSSSHISYETMNVAQADFQLPNMVSSGTFVAAFNDKDVSRPSYRDKDTLRDFKTQRKQTTSQESRCRSFFPI